MAACGFVEVRVGGVPSPTAGERVAADVLSDRGCHDSQRQSSPFWSSPTWVMIPDSACNRPPTPGVGCGPSGVAGNEPENGSGPGRWVEVNGVPATGEPQRNSAGDGLSDNESYVKRTPVPNPRSETASDKADGEAAQPGSERPEYAGCRAVYAGCRAVYAGFWESGRGDAPAYEMLWIAPVRNRFTEGYGNLDRCFGFRLVYGGPGWVVRSMPVDIHNDHPPIVVQVHTQPIGYPPCLGARARADLNVEAVIRTPASPVSASGESVADCITQPRLLPAEPTLPK